MPATNLPTTKTFDTSTLTPYSNNPDGADGSMHSGDPTAVNNGVGATPNITNASGAATGGTTASGSFSTDVADGTAYIVTTTSATPPSVTQIQAGQDNAGVAAAYASNVAISQTGQVAFSITGLTENTVYYNHYQHQAGNGNNSTVITSAAFTPSVNTGMIFFDDFSSGDLSKQLNGAAFWTGGAYTSVQPHPTIANQNSLEFRFVPAPTERNWSEQRFDLGGNFNELWVQYDMLVPTNYYHTGTGLNNKVGMYVWTDDYGSPTGGVAGGMEIYSDGTGFGQFDWNSYYPLNQGHILDSERGFTPRAIRTEDLGVTRRITLHVKAGDNNTAPWSNAVVEFYIDGAIEYAISQANVENTIGAGTGQGYMYNSDGLFINQGYLMGAANAPFNVDTYFYLSNIEFARDAASLTNAVVQP